MPKPSQRFGFDVPDDFPIEVLESLHGRVSDGRKSIHAQRPDVWQEWAGGCNGTIYRFMGTANACDEWTSTYTDRPAIDLHLRQDVLLFEFFVSALSSMECLAYGLCAIGEYLKPKAFPVTSKPGSVKFRFAATAFGKEYSGQALARELQAIDASAEMSELRKTRNILAHRSAPARTFSETLTSTRHGGTAVVGPTMWLGDALGPKTLEEPREWVAEKLTDLVEAADVLVQQEL